MRVAVTSDYRVALADGREAARARIAHAVIGASSGAPAAIPPALREALERTGEAGP